MVAFQAWALWRTKLRNSLSANQEQGTVVRIASSACTLYATPSWLGKVSRSVPASAIASSFQMLDQHIQLSSVGAAEDCPRGPVDVSDLILVITSSSK